METIKQAFKYGVVGLGNTLITAAVIWIMMKILGCNEIISNIVGYAIGLINSFIWNKQWTFKSSAGWRNEAIRFGVVFGICYSLQLALMIYLKKNLTIDPYYCQLLAMVFYTVINFILNKFYTFKSQKNENVSGNSALL